MYEPLAAPLAAALDAVAGNTAGKTRRASLLSVVGTLVQSAIVLSVPVRGVATTSDLSRGPPLGPVVGSGDLGHSRVGPSSPSWLMDSLASCTSLMLDSTEVPRVLDLVASGTQPGSSAVRWLAVLACTALWLLLTDILPACIDLLARLLPCRWASLLHCVLAGQRSDCPGCATWPIAGTQLLAVIPVVAVLVVAAVPALIYRPAAQGWGNRGKLAAA
ncbi:hypothetical protein HaLaN_29678 [Haematococcus lacustris]|uniref:Uncharacterized protein n=1 Tax=Haematococcus lacustris TaxID=44745 RepID=A0A6A0AD20_HAELA|nr:hypothetical protein HaLaN_29678 [Haematococcus lacustris]